MFGSSVRSLRQRRTSCLLCSWLTLCAGSVYGDDITPRPEPTLREYAGTEALAEGCQGRISKPKRNHVPIYASSEKAAEVIGYLLLGSQVCAIGEQGELAILQWNGSGENRLKFVRKVDLLDSRPRPREESGSFLGKLRSIYNSATSGVVPEDPLAPYRPIINSPLVNPQVGHPFSGGDCNIAAGCAEPVPTPKATNSGEIPHTVTSQ